MIEKFYYLSNFLYKKRIPFLPRLIMNIMHLVFSCSIPYQASIGKNCRFGHGGIGIVINAKTKIGNNCRIGTCVTIGGTNKIETVPTIGNNVLISTGAKIIGPVQIGDNVVIGANAVVVKNVPSNCIVGGIPAKIIKENIDINDYL